MSVRFCACTISSPKAEFESFRFIMKMIKSAYLNAEICARVPGLIAPLVEDTVQS